MKAKINFVGDVSLFRKYEEFQIDPFKKIWLPDCDYNIGNFEFVIPNNRKKNFYDVQDNYSCSYDFFNTLEVNKFNLFGLANNHSMDYGINGLKDTIEIFKKKGVRYFGIGNNPDYNIRQFEIQGISFCIIGAIKEGRWSKESNNGWGPDEYNFKKLIHLIETCKIKNDHVLIFPHWGPELVDIPNPELISDAKAFIDHGASAVIGHHPHVSQGIERYKEGIIAFSLGSFIYIPAEELGYEGLKERDISICLSINFKKDSISDYYAYLYKHNTKDLIPELSNDESTREYFNFLNNNIHNSKLHYKKVKTILLKREVYSFIKRFKDSPLKTLHNYFKYIQPRHIRKLFS